MSNETTSNMSVNPQNRVAFFTLITSSFAIFILAIVAMINSTDENASMTIFNTTLPVFASWIGTVLAFYFGRENFESANKQVRNIVSNLKHKSQNSVDTIMITPYAMTTFKMLKENDEENIDLIDLKDKLSTYDVSRLPIIDNKKQIKYILHRSKIDNYLLNYKKETDKKTLKNFLELNNQIDMLDNESRRFIIVSKYTPLEEAQKRLQKCKKCKDIFVTQNGTENEEMIGWIPDVHLLEYLEI